MESHKVILKEALTVEIEKERKSLVETAFKEGFTSSNTVEISQFIDEMLNELEKINRAIRNKKSNLGIGQ
ncbi:aspartyl-phosphate phosphatase Spo0E family protein [Priestia megaterium]|uniref:aspartyl-phosphate phosphatase Spo0E family protein n=1 Tax=Priestia megaterium TaxID=1404 RepID=UPI001C23FF9A|nr:aspartyl-phosphate phosphatase Spo0E family protein [Priestia megaterium]MBU8691178.1 aspartyl-phosphate phosphatase Spo0E family protein [Priestia megaterium]MED3937926.1 aspartyl-phosphate phosphatase Spo0E family protein [Priestia megaterium]